MRDDFPKLCQTWKYRRKNKLEKFGREKRKLWKFSNVKDHSESPSLNDDIFNREETKESKFVEFESSWYETETLGSILNLATKKNITISHCV